MLGSTSLMTTKPLNYLFWCVQGFELAKQAALSFLQTFKQAVSKDDREMLRCVARTSLRTKLYETLADQLTDIVVDAVLTTQQPDVPLDLYMVLPLRVLPTANIPDGHTSDYCTAYPQPCNGSIAANCWFRMQASPRQ